MGDVDGVVRWVTGNREVVGAAHAMLAAGNLEDTRLVAGVVVALGVFADDAQYRADHAEADQRQQAAVQAIDETAIATRPVVDDVMHGV